MNDAVDGFIAAMMAFVVLGGAVLLTWGVTWRGVAHECERIGTIEYHDQLFTCARKP